MRINSINNYDTRNYKRKNVSFKNLKIFPDITTKFSIRKYNTESLNRLIDNAGESIKNLTDAHVHLNDYLKPKVVAKAFLAESPDNMLCFAEYEPPFKLDIISPTQIILNNGQRTHMTFNNENAESMNKSYGIMAKGKPQGSDISDFVLTEDLLMSCCELAKNIQRAIDNFRINLCKKEFTNAPGYDNSPKTNYDYLSEGLKKYTIPDYPLYRLKDNITWKNFDSEHQYDGLIEESPERYLNMAKPEDFLDIIERNYLLTRKQFGE